MFRLMTLCWCNVKEPLPVMSEATREFHFILHCCLDYEQIALSDEVPDTPLQTVRTMMALCDEMKTLMERNRLLSKVHNLEFFKAAPTPELLHKNLPNPSLKPALIKEDVGRML
jgi:hypothetical protein